MQRNTIDDTWTVGMRHMCVCVCVSFVLGTEQSVCRVLFCWFCWFLCSGKAAAVCLEECVLVARGNISAAILRQLEGARDLLSHLAGDESDWMVADAMLTAMTCAYKIGRAHV